MKETKMEGFIPYPFEPTREQEIVNHLCKVMVLSEKEFKAINDWLDTRTKKDG